MSFIGKENKRLVSVILPVYNAAETVRHTIQSVIEQSYTHWELLIINDGSEDASAAVITECVRNLSDPMRTKIKFIQNTNGGPSKARNTGIELAQGEFVAFIDSDDIWIIDKLQMQIDISARFPDAGIISGGFERSLFKSEKKFAVINFTDLLKRNYFNTPTVLLERRKLGESRFDENQRFSEDYRLWLELTYRYKGIYLNETIAKSITGKLSYGISGLSSNLWQMEKGELSNFYFLWKTKRIKTNTLLLSSTFSILKFLRRILILAAKRFGI